MLMVGGIEQVVAATLGTTYRLTLDTTARARTLSPAQLVMNFLIHPHQLFLRVVHTLIPLVALGLRGV